MIDPSNMRVLTMVILSICLSWCHEAVPFQDQVSLRIRISPHDSLTSLVFCDKISCHWVKGVPQKRGRKMGKPWLIHPA